MKKYFYEIGESLRQENFRTAVTGRMTSLSQNSGVLTQDHTKQIKEILKFESENFKAVKWWKTSHRHLEAYWMWLPSLWRFFVNLVCLQGNIFKKSLILKIEFRAVFIRNWKEDSKHRPCYLYLFFLRRSEILIQNCFE